jgi:hypothetical protein
MAEPPGSGLKRDGYGRRLSAVTVTVIIINAGFKRVAVRVHASAMGSAGKRVLKFILQTREIEYYTA